MSELKYHISKKFNETYTVFFISDDGSEQTITGNGAIFQTDIMTNITSIDTFTDDCDGENSTVYFKKYFKYKNGDEWTDLIEIEKLSGMTFTSCSDLELQLYYFRAVDGDEAALVTPAVLSVTNIFITGKYNLSEYESEAQLPNEGDTVILAPDDIYKVFSLSNFSVLSAPHQNYDIKFRFTQDNGRTFTPWELLTKENIETIKLNPLRFAKAEYAITNLDSRGLLIYDIILEGDFQNVSANYLKTNRYGLKEDCLTGMLNGSDGITSASPIPGADNTNRDFYTSCISSYQTNTDISSQIYAENTQASGNFWNPYQQSQKITSFANMLGNQVSSVLGWTVDYHLTDPDGNGIDKYMNEYTLTNIVDVKKIKIVVPDNKFPIETMIINQFNLNLFDTFEVHIMKDEFKRAFGPSKRPSQDDILYICEANMLYYVKHSQAKKDIMNAALYYRIILEKYEMKTNMRNLVKESQDKIDALTDNTTIDSLFGDSHKESEKQVANKLQTYPTSFDKIRHTISTKTKIVKNDILVDGFKISKQYYNLSNVAIKNKTAVDYTKADNKLLKSDNRSFIFWFNFNNAYDEDSRPNNTMYQEYFVRSGVEFNFLNNYDTGTTGYKIYYRGDSLFFKLNENMYKLEKQLSTNVWYAGVINLDQRQETLRMSIYRRNGELSSILIEPTSFIKVESISGTTEYNDYLYNGYKRVDNIESNVCTDFELVASTSYGVAPVEFEHTESLKLLGSNIKYTNLRILNDVIPDDSITNLLKEEILRDEQNLILADNATKQLITTVYQNNNWR